MNELKIFRHTEFGELGILMVDGKELFPATESARILRYANPQQAIRRYCKGVREILTPTAGGKQKKRYITEGDLYRLIAHSKLPAAERFEHWVFDDLLPTIRKTGGYIANSDLFVDTYFKSASVDQRGLVKFMCLNIEEQQKQITGLTAENDALAAGVLKWEYRPFINAAVRKLGANMGIGISGIKLAWVDLKRELLYKHGININARKADRMAATGKRTEPATLDMLTEDELPAVARVIVAMCKESHVDISELLKNIDSVA